MEVNISYLPDEQIVVVKTSGTADAQSSSEMVKNIMIAMKMPSVNPLFVRPFRY